MQGCCEMRGKHRKVFVRQPPCSALTCYRLLLMAGAWLLLAPAAPAAVSGHKPVAGWVEHVLIYPGPIRLKAKMDTGAKTSSLSVISIRHYSRNGHPWVRFRVYNSNGRPITLERPLVRTVLIKRHGEAPKPRPVVMLKLCLGSVLSETQVDLANRKNYLYPLLVGRRYLAGRFLVDPSRMFAASPGCNRSR